ncbi:MAG: FAD-dependent oxidoreductase [Cyanobacteriota bacterium]|nr:FAD-dependent oxidoreductase [Cyanobacteriota bacterium]
MVWDVIVVGCGVVGAAISYQLAASGLSVVCLDAAAPASASTGAALGVLMGVSSQQVSGEVVQLRLKSWQAFEPLIAQLEADCRQVIPVNRHGLLHLLPPGSLSDWQATLEARQAAGYRLEVLDPQQINCLQAGLGEGYDAAIYSPHDRQIEPQVFTRALIQAAAQRGTQFHFYQAVTHFQAGHQQVRSVHTAQETFSSRWVVLAAGLGSARLAGLRLQPVKGVALSVESPHVCLNPVITAADTHLIPRGDGSIWVGATVEFQFGIPSPTLTDLATLIQRATAICPGLATATLQQAWAGLRPRPQQQRAPILGLAAPYDNLIVATGHYRNGVLLAPITAQIVRDLILEGETSLCDLSYFSPPIIKEQAVLLPNDF